MSELAAPAADLPPSDIVLEGARREVGRHLVSRHLELVEQPEAELPAFESDEVSVLDMISKGNTVNQTARELGIEREEALSHQQSAMAKLGVTSPTAATHQAIRHGVISVEVAPDRQVTDGLVKPDRRMLKFWAAGVSEFDLARHPSLSLQDLKDYQKGLLKRVGAWSRPHAVRRAHELGILA